MASSYGLPIKVFLKHLNLSLDDLEQYLSTISILCFIALNPPLPPFNINPPDYAESWNWSDMYPPIRFVRLLDAIPEIGHLKKNNPSHEEISNYINSIVELTKVPSIIENVFPEQYTPKQFEKYDSGMQFDTFSYLFWVQKKLAEFRTNKLPIISNLASCFYGDLSSLYMNDIIDSGDVKIPFIKSPLIWTDNDIGYYGDNDFCNKLLVSATSNYCLTDLLIGSNEYDLKQFPERLRNDLKFKADIDKIIQKSILEIRNQ
jgi:hypothetical protein